VEAHRDELALLSEYGFIVEIPRKKSGIRYYGFSAVEIGLYSLLSHVFESAPHQERAAVMDGIVAHWRQTSSEQELAAFAAILPAFLTESDSKPINKIVRRMLWISFGASVLEATSRSALFAEYESEVDSHVVVSKELILVNVPSELLKRALLKFRDKVGLMPDFAELEQKLRPSLRYFDGINNQILKSNFTIEEWENKGHLKKFGRTELLDALYLLSKGDFSWLPRNADKAAIIRVARAIANHAAPHRMGFPIDSQHPYLAEIITRRYPKDLALILKTNRGSGVPISLKNEHVATLANLVIEAYKDGDWEPLSSCFINGDMMATDLQILLRRAFLENGDIISFTNVFINGGQEIFCKWPQSTRERVVQLILHPESNVTGVVTYLGDRPLRVIRDKHPDGFARITERVWEKGAPRPILRVIANRPPDSRGKNDVEIRMLIAQLDTSSLCIAISMSEFFDILLPAVSIPIAAVAELTIPGESVTAGAELTLEALSLLQHKKQHLVNDGRWASVLMACRLDMKRFAQFAPTFEAPDISWSLERCKVYIQARIRNGIQQGRQVELDRILRTALLNVHESQFNGIYIRVAVAMVSDADAEYRMSVARRLILSGFDLWEVSNAGYACPMLSDLLAEVDNALSVDERVAWVKWMRRNYRQLRKLPLFRTYSIREFWRVDAAQKAFFDLRFDGTVGVIEFLLPYVDRLFKSPMEEAEGFARQLLEAIEECDEGLSEFGKRYPDELKGLQAFLPRPIQPSAPKVTVDDVLDAFANAIDGIPLLPASLRQWDGVAPPRSMLSPVGDDGYKSYAVEEFRSSLTGG